MPNTLMKVAKATAAVSARPAPASASTSRPAKPGRWKPWNTVWKTNHSLTKPACGGIAARLMAAEQRAKAEQPCGAFDQQRMPDQVAARRDEYTIGGEEQPAFRQRMPGEVQQRDRPGEPSQVRQTALPEQQSSAQRVTAIAAFSAEEKLSRQPPIFLLECVQHRQDRAEHADRPR